MIQIVYSRDKSKKMMKKKKKKKKKNRIINLA